VTSSQEISADAPKMPVELDEPNSVQTRRGLTRVTSERIPRDRHRSWVTIEGYHEAVISAVADRMHRCTQCYEHMFTVYAIEQFPNNVLRVKCIENLYAGD
jgi:hypothetical protein